MASERAVSPAKQEDAVATSRDAHSEPYAAFSNGQRYMIIALQGISMLASPLTATMYLPLLPTLSNHFNVSIHDINLTITVYIIFQAIAPLLLAGSSDYSGRRPVFLLCFGLYTLASLGLALNTSSFAGLIVLRALQSLGASAVLSVSYGTIADISVPAERGKLLGPLLTASNVGTCKGPIIGGAIAYR
jgi:MFS family permease